MHVSLQLNLSKLETVNEDEVKSAVHNVQCIYNALSDIKAEVENVIKIGRKVVESSETDHLLKEKLTLKIDSLKEEFNVAGNEVYILFIWAWPPSLLIPLFFFLSCDLLQVSETQQKLEKTLQLSQKCYNLLATIREWLDKNENFEVLSKSKCSDGDIPVIGNKLFEMSKYKYSFVELNR